jgi:coenzyme F420-reducing hydrogenase gamma subunit
MSRTPTGVSLQLARVALEEARADVFFQRGHAVGHRRLRDVEPVARRAKAAQPRGPEKGFDKSCIHEGTCGAFCPQRALR